MRKLFGEIERWEARDPGIEEASLTEDFLVRARLEGVQQRKRGSRLGCGTRQFFSGTASGSTAGAAEEQVSPTASICVSALGLTGTLLNLVFGITVSVFFLVRGSVFLPTRFAAIVVDPKQSVQVAGASFGIPAASLRSRDSNPDSQNKNARSEGNPSGSYLESR